MKKSAKILVAALCLAMAAGSFSGCQGSSGSQSSQSSSAPASEAAGGESSSEGEAAGLPLSGEHFVIATEAECPGFETIDENGEIVDPAQEAEILEADTPQTADFPGDGE